MQFDITDLEMHDFEFWEKTAAKIIGVCTVQQGFTGVTEFPNAYMPVEQRVKEDQYEQLQVIGDALG